MVSVWQVDWPKVDEQKDSMEYRPQLSPSLLHPCEIRIVVRNNIMDYIACSKGKTGKQYVLHNVTTLIDYNITLINDSLGT